MAQVHDNLKVGDQVTWKSINYNPTGIVEAIDERGALVRLPSGKYVILSTTQSLNHKYGHKGGRAGENPVNKY